MSEIEELECPTCNQSMNELTQYEGLWSCAKCRKIWIEQFESDFKLTKPKKIKNTCPGCESSLNKAKDDQGKESFIFCSDCGGIQLTYKQTFMFQDERLSEEIKLSFQKKSKTMNKQKSEKVNKKVKEKTKANSEKKKPNIIIRLLENYGYSITFITTLFAVLPGGIWLSLIGSASFTQFTQIPYLDSFPLVTIILLLLVPGTLISLKEIKPAKIGLWLYFIFIHFYLVWGFSPLIQTVVDFDYYRNVTIEDKNKDGIEDALIGYIDSRVKTGAIKVNQIQALKDSLKTYHLLIDAFYTPVHPFSFLHSNDYSSSTFNKSIEQFYVQFCEQSKIDRSEKMRLLKIIHTNPRNLFVKDHLFLIPRDVSSALSSCR